MNKLAKSMLHNTECKTGLSSKFCVILGIQWGQEDKQKLLDKLCYDYDYSCRFNGGASKNPVELENGDEVKVLPMGVQHDTPTKCIVGNGVVIKPADMLSDFEALENNGL